MIATQLPKILCLQRAAMTFLTVAALSAAQNVLSQDIQGSVLDKETNEPISGVAVKITQKSDTSIYKYITTGENGLYETEAPIDTTVGINPREATESVWLNYVGNQVEIRIADENFRNVQGSVYGMDARLLANAKRDQEGEYTVFKFNIDEIDAKSFAFQAGAYGGVFTEHGFRFNTDVQLGMGGFNFSKNSALKGTANFEDYIFTINEEGYEPLEEEHSLDMENANVITHYLQKTVPTYMFDILGELVPGGDTLLLLATGSQGTDTLYNDIANPNFALQYESLDETLNFQAIAENDSMKLDSAFTKEAGEHYLTLEMKEKEKNMYAFCLTLEPEGSHLVAYVRNDPTNFADNDTLFNAIANTRENLIYYSFDSTETMVFELSHPDYNNETNIETFEPGVWSRVYDLRD